MHEHVAERAPSIHRCCGLATIVSFVHTKYVESFVGFLSQQESAAWDAAARVSDALVKARLPVHPRHLLFRRGHKKAGSSIQRGRLSECLAGGFGSSVLPCLMSHLGVGRARTKLLACWLAASHFGFGAERESSWLLSTRLALSFNAEAGKDDASGCPSFVNFGWQRA